MWTVKIVRVYTGPDNKSYFEDLHAPMSEIPMNGRASYRTAVMPTSSILFRENPLGPPGVHHNATQRQFVVTISGAVEITCAGGTRVFGPGAVLFAEDLTGEGHANRELHGPRRSMIIPVPADFDIHRFTKPLSTAGA